MSAKREFQILKERHALLYWYISTLHVKLGIMLDYKTVYKYNTDIEIRLSFHVNSGGVTMFISRVSPASYSIYEVLKKCPFIQGLTEEEERFLKWYLQIEEEYHQLYLDLVEFYNTRSKVKIMTNGVSTIRIMGADIIIDKGYNSLRLFGTIHPEQDLIDFFKHEDEFDIEFVD